MDIKEYIATGILELYVAGSLSEKENTEIFKMMEKHPEVLAEVKSIETAIVTLTSALSTKDTKQLFSELKNKIEPKVISISKPKSNILKYSGWAATVVFSVFLAWSLNENNKLQQEIAKETNERKLLEDRIIETNTNLAEATKLVNIFRDDSVISVQLAGQAVAPEAYAKVYVDKKTERLYLDVQGLPEPPKGKVYQVWSLQLDPLTPTSMGTLDSFVADADKIFEFKTRAGEQAFGITLEPEGGSDSPTLEQLYTLGVIPS